MLNLWSVSSRRSFALVIGILALVVGGSILWGLGDRPTDSSSAEDVSETELDVGASIETEEDPNARATYEWRRLHDPETGEIPNGVRKQELELASSLPDRIGPSQDRSWVYQGPDGDGAKTGGRTRALAVDVTDQSVLLAGGVSGGMFRSTDGGATWERTTAPAQLPSITDVEQDPRSGNTSTWYAGTGEVRGNSATGGGRAFYAGNGIYESTDGGRSWTLLQSTQSSRSFDYVWDVEVDASNSSNEEIYAATWFGIYRSTDGGGNWNQVRSNSGSNFSDVAVGPNGTVYAATNNGIFTSPDGQSWTDRTPSNFPLSDASRTEIAIDPSNPDRVWFFTNSGGSGSGPNGHTLFRWDDSSQSWTEFSNRLPNRGGQTGTLNTQGSYDQVVAVHPDDGNIVFVGGRNLWRIDISEPASDPNTWIGGYTADNNNFGFYNPQNSESHHPDQHAVAFRPSDGDVMYVGSDGGLHRTNDSRAGAAGTAGDKAVKWESLNDGYHTNQPYAVCMHSTSSRIGWGMQDNGSMSTSHLTPADQWTDELGADGGFCEINDKASGSGTARYFTIQNGPVIRFDYDTNGNRTGGVRVDPQNTSGELFINPFEIDPSDRSVMYYPAGQNLYRTTSAEADPRNNANWTELTGSSSAVSNIITALTASENNASNVLYFGTSGGNLFRLDNANGASAGTSPTDVTGGSFPNGFVSSIAVHPENSDEVIVTFSNYGVTSVFRTTDGGSSWTSIEGNLSGPNGEAPSVRAAAILPASSSPSHQSSTDARYYLGTSVGAFSTTSLSGGSTTWAQEAQDGFENVVVDDIRARSSDGLVVAGTHGKGVFTRGGGTVSDLNLTINSFTLGQFPWIRVLVSVTNQSGNAVSGLGRENFDLTDESRLEGVVKAEEQNQGGSRAISTSMVLDRSGSMDGLLGDLKTAAKQYVDELQQGDRAAVIYFDNTVDLDQQFTDDKSALKSAIDARSTGGSTAIYDATIRGIREVEQEANTRAVISMTDGKENASTNTKQDVIDLANQGEQIPIYTVTLGRGADQSPMQDISSKTGGRHFHAPSASDLTAIYNDISQQLARRYRLTYRTTNESRDGTTRPVKVRAARQEQSGSATGSYDAPSQSVPTVAQYASPPQPGQQTTANVQVGNQSQQVSDLFRMTFTLNYDQNNLQVDNVDSGDLFSGANIDDFRSSVDAQAGEIDIGVRLQSSNSPSAAGVVARRAATDGVDGSGSAADVDFTVDSNAPSDTEPSLSVSNVEASESDGSSIGTVSTSISGSVRYADVDPQGDLTGGDPIEGATVEAIDGGGTAQDSDQSSASTGGYRMPVPPGESYDVVVTDVSGSPQGIDTRDAFDIQANRLGLDNIANFGSFQETLGDVNGDGVADTRDAFAVQAFVVSGNTSPSFQAGKFHSKQAAVNVSTTDETAELRAAAIGDANLDGGFGSSSSPALAVSRTEDVASGGIGTTNGESLKSASSGSTLEVPIRAGISAELGLFEFTVTYPNEKASFQGVESSKDGVEANSQDGTVRVSWFDRRGGESPMSVEKGEPIVVLQFEKTGSLEKNESFRLGDIGGLLGGPSGELLSEASVEVPTVNAGAAGPEHFALKGNAPNPFGRETMLRMDVPEEGRVTVAVYDMLGRRVATIEEKLSPGRDRTVEIEGKQLGSGKYLYRVRAEIGGETVQKSGEMTVVR